MKKLTLIPGLIALLAIVLSCTSTESTNYLTIEELTESFKNPSNAFRGKPFWAWNGELEEEELRRQVGIMKDMGFGGFFMHSRTGLKTEYLGEKWFDVTKACIDEAKKHGLEAWLYDEDRWPSGLAGGLVTQHPEYRMKYVSLYTPSPEDFTWTDSTIAVFTCVLDSINVSRIKRFSREDTVVVETDEVLLVFVEEKMAGWSFFNGYTYLNTLKREATDKFIEVTHEEYKKRFGDEFGTGLKGVFTDEPHNGCVFGGFAMQNKNARRMTTWTDEMPGEFEKEYGYNLVDSLPQLFYRKNGHTVSPVKYHYMSLLQQMYIDNFAKPYYEWCNENNMLLTGHALHENTLMHQALMQGSLMRNYEFMHYPGIDLLGSNRPYWIAKQLSSVARQLDKPFLLTETYAVNGWHLDFQAHKSIGDWQALYGVNLRCPHLSWYTMEGEAKRDYPASIFYQSAWYKDYKNVEDYFARLGFLLKQGKPDCHLLVMNPVESLWPQIHTGWANVLSATGNNIKKLDKQYQTTFAWLQEAKIDFDYGDEDIMARHYSVGKNKNGKAILKVGAAEYQTVLVGGMVTMRQSTLDILNEFKNAGGNIVFTGKLPQYIDAVPSENIENLAEKSQAIPFENKILINTLKELLPPVVKITDNTGKSIDDIAVQRRFDGEREIIVCLNNSKKRAYDDVSIKIPTKGAITEWDCKTAKRYAIESNNPAQIEIKTNLPINGERVYVVTPMPIPDLPSKETLQTEKTITAQGPYKYTLDEPNICVLDLATYTIEGKSYNTVEEVLKIDRQVRKHYNMPHRDGRMLQPWFRAKFGPEYKKGGPIALNFSFNVETLPEGELYLVTERPDYKEFYINGKAIEKNTDGWFIDNALQKILIQNDLLKKGKNYIKVTMDFSEEMEIEAMYLIGDFGVSIDKNNIKITELPETISATNLTQQGLPFYTGKVTYHIPIPNELMEENNVFVKFSDFEAACINVHDKGKITNLGWHPFETHIAGNSTEIQAEIVLTRRNTFGPLHLIPLKSPVIGPQHFITTGNRFTYNYQLYPSGLLKEPIFHVKK